MTISFHLLWRRQLWPKAISLAKTSSPCTALLFQAVLFSMPLAIQDPFFPFSANPHFLKQILSFSLQPRFPFSLPRNLWERRRCFYLWRNVPVQEANTHQSNTDAGPFKCAVLRGGVAWWEGFLGYTGRGLRSHFCPLPSFIAFTKVIYVLWAWVSSF